MMVLTGLLILLAVVIATGLTVLGAIASAVEIVPPWFSRDEETLNTTPSAPRTPLVRARRSEPTRTRA